MVNMNIKKYEVTFTSERAREAGKKSKRGKSITTIINEILSVEYPTPEKLKNIFPNEKYSGKELMVMAQMAKAIKEDTQAFNALIDRLDGKPKQTTDLTVSEKPRLQDICSEKLSKKELLRLAGLK